MFTKMHEEHETMKQHIGEHFYDVEDLMDIIDSFYGLYPENYGEFVYAYKDINTPYSFDFCYKPDGDGIVVTAVELLVG